MNIISVNSTRRVKHSRGGCKDCKERKLRCSEEKPSCSRCVRDNRQCQYIFRLKWEEDSKKEGKRHGRSRGAQSDNKVVDPTPSYALIKNAQWRKPRDQRRYFLNTTVGDVESQVAQHVRSWNSMIWRIPNSRPGYSLSTLNLNPSDGMLFAYYQSSVCRNLTLVDEGSNGYHHIILPMAIQHGSVMASLLAVGALYLSLSQPSSAATYAVALNHKQKTLNCLRRDLASLNEVTTDSVLLSMLLLCLFDITDNCQHSWSTHLAAADNLLRLGNTINRQPSLASFVSKFFAARDVLGRTACGAKSKFQVTSWHDPSEIDTTVGCSRELMKIISTITDLSRQLLELDGEDDIVLSDRLLELENVLDSVVQVVPELSATSPPSSRILLIQTSELIYSATIIYFYTVLHSATPSTQLIRTYVIKQIKLLESISVLRSAHLWSIFVTALYCYGDEERIFFLGLFDRLKDVSAAMGPTQAARVVVETVWKRRDLDEEISATTCGSGPKVSDWNRLVRPLSEGLSLA